MIFIDGWGREREKEEEEVRGKIGKRRRRASDRTLCVSVRSSREGTSISFPEVYMIKMNGKIGKIGFSYFSKSVCVFVDLHRVWDQDG